MLSTRMRTALRAWMFAVLAFLYAPLLLVLLNAFNSSKTFALFETGEQLVRGDEPSPPSRGARSRAPRPSTRR